MELSQELIDLLFKCAFRATLIQWLIAVIFMPIPL
jgi:hypothetical protein